jgi:hypothetical protein
MRAKLSAVARLLLVFALAGCVTSSTKLNSVHLGMAKSDLVRQLGQPDSASAQANTEYLTYYLSNDNTVRNEPYMVRLVDGRVESFGRFIRLLDTQITSGPGLAPLGLGAIMPYAMNMDVVTQLQHLKALQDQGVLTAEEVARAKERLLKRE